MNILSFKGYEGTAEIDMDRGVCRGKILFIEDLVTYEADAPKQLKKAFEEAVFDYIETCAAVGKEPQRSLRGSFNVRISPELHRLATLRAVGDSVTLNEVVIRSMDCYLNTRVDVRHDVRVTFEPTHESTQFIQSAASVEPQWRTTRAH